MSKSSKLSAEKQQIYSERLYSLRDALVKEVRNLSDVSLNTNKQAGEELADIGSENFLREMELGLMSDEAKKVALIQDALERLKTGQYGICMDCNKAIGEGRLEAIPYAKLCVNCKAVRESEEYPDQYSHVSMESEDEMEELTE